MPPNAPTLELVDFRRANDDAEGCRSSNSCADYGSLTVSVFAEDDSASGEVGFEFELYAGDAKVRSTAPLIAIDGEIKLTWIDDKPSTPLTVLVWSVDKAGNRSTSSASLQVDAKRESDMCSTSGNYANAPWMVALFLCLTRRRRLLKA